MNVKIAVNGICQVGKRIWRLTKNPAAYITISQIGIIGVTLFWTLGPKLSFNEEGFVSFLFISFMATSLISFIFMAFDVKS